MEELTVTFSRYSNYFNGDDDLRERSFFIKMISIEILLKYFIDVIDNNEDCYRNLPNFLRLLTLKKKLHQSMIKAIR